MALHAFTHLFNISLFDFDPSLFVSTIDLCIKKQSGAIVCCCGYHFENKAEAQQCPKCGNPILEIEKDLCLMAPLVEDKLDTFLQTLYFFTIQSYEARNALMLDRVVTVCFDAKHHRVMHQEFNAINVKEPFEIDLLQIAFAGQSNTLESLQKGRLPLGNDFGRIWNFDQTFTLRKRRHIFPIHVQLSLEWILWVHHERFCPILSDSVSLFMTYYAYLFWRRHSYLNAFALPLLHSKNIDFYLRYEYYDSFKALIEETIFQHKATKPIKRWFYKMFTETCEDGKLFKVDLICVLVRLFNNPDYLLEALKRGQTVEFRGYENIILGADFFKYLAEQKGEKWLLKHIFYDGLYNSDFYDFVTLFPLIKDEYREYTLPKVNSMDNIIDALVQFYGDKCATKSHPSIVPFKHHLIALSLEGEYEGFTFKLPQSPYELCMWSQSHKNCLDSYVEKVAQNKIIILGVFKAQRHCFTLKLSANGEFIYAKGKYNKNISVKELEIVIRYVYKNMKQG